MASDLFDIEPTVIPGCLLLRSQMRTDARGTFVKTAHAGWFAAHGLECKFREQYYSVSYQHVLRGLHFQTPPHDHTKLVFCASGRILDAVVDLRVGSPTYAKHVVLELDAERPAVLYLPPGLAHGFLALTPHALMVYNVTTEYAPSHDAGILWSSAGIPWPIADPIVSDRDASFPRLDEFTSPFVRESAAHAR